MIKINKSKNAPKVLSGQAAANSLQAIRIKVKNGSAISNKDFDRKIYAAKAVKDQLKQDQHNKCAYCECTMEGDNGAVEHFRPKTKYKDVTGSGLGYYWLAYDWDNLLFSCDKCNSAARKGCNFPLRNPADRNIASEDISKEESLIVKPTEEDPADFICFRRHIAVPTVIDDIPSDKGVKTIEIFDLNGNAQSNPRKDLVSQRMQRWRDGLAICDKLISNGMNKADALKFVASLYSVDNSPFSAMFRNQIGW